MSDATDVLQQQLHPVIDEFTATLRRERMIPGIVIGHKVDTADQCYTKTAGLTLAMAHRMLVDTLVMVEIQMKAGTN